MEAIAASKVLFLNSNAFPRSYNSFIRYHHHNSFICYLQSRNNNQLKLVTSSQETHIVKPVLKALTPNPNPNPKPKQIRRLVELVLIGGIFLSFAGIVWVAGVILPKKYNMITENVFVSCSSSIEDISYAFTSGEWELLPFIILYFSCSLAALFEHECTTTSRENVVFFRLLGVISICVLVGCSLRLVSLAHVKDSLLSARDGPLHLILVVFLNLLSISFVGACALLDIRELEDRVNTQICVGSGTQAGDLKSRKQSRRPRKKTRRRRIIVLNKHLGRVSGLGGHIRSLAESEQ